MSETTELRFELPRDDVAVLDGYCSATGKSRTDVMRLILKDWSDRKHYEASMIVRVAGSNPDQPEGRRNG